MGNEKVDKPEYQDIGQATAILGQSQVDSMVGSLLGAAAGGALGATLLHDENKYGQVSDEVKKVLEQDSLKGLEKSVNELGGKKLWNALGRGEKSIVAAVAGAAVVGIVGSVVGLFRGNKKYKKAKEQFDGLVKENTELKEKLATAQQSPAVEQVVENVPAKSFVAAEDARRAANDASKEAALGAARA